MDAVFMCRLQLTSGRLMQTTGPERLYSLVDHFYAKTSLIQYDIEA